MTAKELESHFKKRISANYSRSESRFLYEIFCKKIWNKHRIELEVGPTDEILSVHYNQFKTIISELNSGKPYQYILGEAEFFGMEFSVDENVLIPRPETEELLELAIKKIQSLPFYKQCFKILDIGTGSGIIPIVLKKYFPKAAITSVDFSEKAIEMAQKNAALHKTEISFLHLDYLNTELSGRYDVIISNPPYIGLDEEAEIADSVKKFEPKMALFSPISDPLIFYRKIAKDAQIHLKKKGMIFLEINQKLGSETLELFHHFSKTELIKDISGNNRMIFVTNS